MHGFNTELLIAISLLLGDLLASRWVNVQWEQLRIAVRVLAFGGLTFVLVRSGMVPVGPAPFAGNLPVHLAAQCLELLWWLQLARLAAELLAREVLRNAWNHQRLFRDILSAVIFIAASVAAIAYVLEIPIKGLLATSGAVAVILGLAIQSTLGDVFSGIVLNATQPFTIGDWVFIGDVEGKIVESDWRSTSLLNAQGNIVVIPNSVAAKANIINHSQPPRVHGVSVLLEFPFQERSRKVLRALEFAAAGAIDIMMEPKPVVKVQRATATSMQYEIVGYVDALTKTTSARNALFDLSQRHLAASDFHLRAQSETHSADGLQTLLRQVEMFDSVADSELAVLAQSATLQEYLSGEIIWNPEKYADASAHHALLIVAKGVATLFVARNIQDIELRRLSPGDAVGQSAILAGTTPNATLKAITPVTICSIDKVALTPVLHARPEVASQMCRIVASRMTDETTLLHAEPGHPAKAGTFYERLRDGVRRLHDLVLH